jgi:hypothetical protein
VVEHEVVVWKCRSSHISDNGTAHGLEAVS